MTSWLPLVPKFARRPRVRVVAAIPAAGILAGAALGLLAPDLPPAVGVVALIACTGGAVWAWRAGGWRALAVCAGLAFGAGGELLAARSWREAWRPTLRVVFEDLARAERAQAALEHRLLPEDDEAFAIVEGVLRQDGAIGPSGASLSIDVDRICSATFSGSSATLLRSRDVAGGVLATVVGSFAADRIDLWRAGRRVRVPIQLHRPSRYLDPGVPDHERALARRGTTLVGTVKTAMLVDLVARGGTLDEAMGAVRAFARRAIAAGVGRWSGRSAGIVAAIVLGDRIGLDENVQRALQEAGTYHVIAISGGNIAILAGLMLTAFRFAGLLGRTAMAAAIVALVAYGYLVGGGASVDRATLMAVVYFASRAMDQRSLPFNTLAVVAALLVASGPLELANPAFVLTFGATLAILLIMPMVKTIEVEAAGVSAHPASAVRIAAVARAAAPLAAMFAASVAAEAMLFPVGALVFSRVTFAGLALNFFAIPLMAVAQIAGMALVPAALVSARLAIGVGYVAHLGAEGLVRSAELVHLAPALAYRVAPPGWIFVVAYYSAVAVAGTLWWRRRTVTGSAETRAARASRGAAVVVASCAAAWILAEPWALVVSSGDARLHATFIDVGQGDAAFVRFPRGTTLLVDAGGLSAASTFDIGDRVVAPVLRDAGVRRLDYLALTHGDPDHIGGAASVIREFRPREVWEGIPVPRSEQLQALRDAAGRLGIRWSNVKTGDRITLDGVEVVVRHPPPADWERQKVRNDDSIVIELRWRDVSVMLTGDIGRGVERTLLEAIPPAPLRILKVPHHGSPSSSTTDFLRATAPRIAVVSAGRGNHFGHPSPDVLERYRIEGATVFRTDQDGAVMVDTDGRSVNVRTFTGRQMVLP